MPSQKFNQMLLSKLMEKSDESVQGKIMLNRINSIMEMISIYVKGGISTVVTKEVQIESLDNKLMFKQLSKILKEVSYIKKKVEILENRQFISQPPTVGTALEEEEVLFIPDINITGMKINTIATKKTISGKKISEISQELKKIDR